MYIIIYRRFWKKTLNEKNSSDIFNENDSEFQEIFMRSKVDVLLCFVYVILSFLFRIIMKQPEKVVIIEIASKLHGIWYVSRVNIPFFNLLPFSFSFIVSLIYFEQLFPLTFCTDYLPDWYPYSYIQQVEHNFFVPS